MKFNVGDKVIHKHRLEPGVVIKLCVVVYGCIVVEWSDRKQYHYHESTLSLVKPKGQQLLFEFMS